MRHEFCTLFDSNYLPRALALHESLREHDPDFVLRAFCMDDAAKRILDRLDLPGLVAIGLDELEAHDSDLAAVKDDRTPVEYCWTATPAILLATLEREPELESITYLDADVAFFGDPEPLFAELGDGSVQIVPHRYAPEHAHHEEPSGIYNVEWLTFRNDAAGLEVLRWWRERCLEWCYHRVEDGKLGDQKYLDDWPERFPAVRILQHVGGGLAPWNVTRYRLDERGGRVFVDDAPLVFYHFQTLVLYGVPSLLVPWLGSQPRRLMRARRAALVWSAGYEIEHEELRLIWVPYLERLARAVRQIRSVEPGFSAGFIRTRAYASEFAHRAVTAAYRRISATAAAR
jgi:hypothetical protein